MGELLTQLVPLGAYVRIPVTDDSDASSSECYRVCKCGRHNLLHRCRYIGCIASHQCQLHYGMIQGYCALYKQLWLISTNFKTLL